jgi:hypothetical protein
MDGINGHWSDQVWTTVIKFIGYDDLTKKWSYSWVSWINAIHDVYSLLKKMFTAVSMSSSCANLFLHVKHPTSTYHITWCTTGNTVRRSKKQLAFFSFKKLDDWIAIINLISFPSRSRFIVLKISEQLDPSWITTIWISLRRTRRHN